jgi:exopolyphosphatase/pppGpp-phosphohydrolase
MTGIVSCREWRAFGTDLGAAGALIVRMMIDKLQQKQLRVSDCGIRHGVLIDRSF